MGDSTVTGVVEYGIDPASLMRGEAKTDVALTILRPGENEPRTFVVTRGEIPVFSVDAAYKIDENTAYVKVNRFAETTRDEFVRALEQHLEKGEGHSLILDLRDNPGGYMNVAVGMLSQIFPEKDLLMVYTEGRNSRRYEYKTDGRAFYNIRNVAILVDEGSASASEIVAGAIQDHDRGIIVGRRTFGKGLVQEQYPLSDSSALRLTIARYYTPSGRSIQRNYDDGETAYRSDIGQRFESGELTGDADFVQDSSQLYYTDNGHPVFGGGGITPDYFVPLDTTLNDEVFLRLRQQIPSYLFTYLRENAWVNGYTDAEEYIRKFEVKLDDVLPGLYARAERDYEGGIGDLAPRFRKPLALYFKARLARQLYDNSTYYRILNQDDEIVNTALRLMNTNDPLAEARQ